MVSNEDLEAWELDRFRKRFSGFPEGRITRSLPPAPDFTVETAYGRLGVELTQAYWDRGGKGSASKRRMSAFDQVLARARQEWTHRGHAPVWVDLNWHDHYEPPTGEVAERLVQQLVGAVEKLRPHGVKEVRLVAYPDPDWRLLPPEVSILTVNTFGADGWFAAWASSIAPLSAPQVQAEVDRKESKLAAYREHCDEVWLLIWVDQSVPGGAYAVPFDFNPDEHPIRTGFDRVFFHSAALFEFSARR